MNQVAFFGDLESDIAAADDRIVIYSPFVTRNRPSEIRLHLEQSWIAAFVSTS